MRAVLTRVGVALLNDYGSIDESVFQQADQHLCDYAARSGLPPDGVVCCITNEQGLIYRSASFQELSKDMVVKLGVLRPLPGQAS